MANPQLENGYTKLANEFIEKFCRFRLSGEEWMVLWVIIRKTYGYQKKEDNISLSQFAILTDRKRSNIIRAVKKLVSKKILLIIKKDTSFGNKYAFNKNFDQWTALSKKIPVVSKKIMGVIKKDNGGSLKKDTYKRNGNTKENITKEIYHFLQNPDFEKIFNQFLEMRKTIKKPLTFYGQELLLKKLHKETLEVAIKMLEQSIENSWQGVFPLKENKILTLND